MIPPPPFLCMFYDPNISTVVSQEPGLEAGHIITHATIHACLQLTVHRCTSEEDIVSRLHAVEIRDLECARANMPVSGHEPAGARSSETLSRFPSLPRAPLPASLFHGRTNMRACMDMDMDMDCACACRACIWTRFGQAGLPRVTRCAASLEPRRRRGVASARTDWAGLAPVEQGPGSACAAASDAREGSLCSAMAPCAARAAHEQIRASGCVR